MLASRRGGGAVAPLMSVAGVWPASATSLHISTDNARRVVSVVPPKTTKNFYTENTGKCTLRQQQKTTTKNNNKKQQQKTTTKNNNKKQQQKTTTKNNNKKQQQKTTTKNNNKKQQQKTTTKSHGHKEQRHMPPHPQSTTLGVQGSSPL